MDAPVKMPSGSYVDESAYKDWTIRNNTDPFSRVPLPNDSFLKPDAKLQKRINDFMLETIDCWREVNTGIKRETPRSLFFSEKPVPNWQEMCAKPEMLSSADLDLGDNQVPVFSLSGKY